MTSPDKSDAIEWPTLGLILLCTLAVPLLTYFSASLTLWLTLPLLTVVLALFSSVQHEVLHGHPFRSNRLNEALVFIPMGLYLPYRRFKATHIQHHRDPNLTDPYDDPETNFQDPAVWAKTGFVTRGLLSFNNSLLGRMLVGPIISFYVFYKCDAKLILAGDRAVILAYLLHFVGLIPLVYWLAMVSTMPLWAYMFASYGAISILKIRTYLEHRAHADAKGRTVIIEDHGILAFLFLNNNLHAVHHAHPKLAWYNIPRVYKANKAAFLAQNDGYFYTNYRSIFRQYFFKTKDQVPHPIWSSKNRQ